VGLTHPSERAVETLIGIAQLKVPPDVIQNRSGRRPGLGMEKDGVC
jgi:hypothetical protein